MSEQMTRRRFVRIAASAAGLVVLGGGGYMAAEWAPAEGYGEYTRKTMGVGMSRVLVVYGTKTGCTAGIAEQIGKTLAEVGATVEVKPVEDAPDVSAYDAVVVGSGIRVGSWHAAAKEWVTSEADGLKEMPTAFFTTCLTLATEPDKAGEVRAYTDPLIQSTGVEPVDVGLFAGMNEPRRFSLPERLVMKAMKAPQGDFRDMAAVAEWARGLTGKLGLA